MNANKYTRGMPVGLPIPGLNDAHFCPLLSFSPHSHSFVPPFRWGSEGLIGEGTNATNGVPGTLWGAAPAEFIVRDPAEAAKGESGKALTSIVLVVQGGEPKGSMGARGWSARDARDRWEREGSMGARVDSFVTMMDFITHMNCRTTADPSLLPHI